MWLAGLSLRVRRRADDVSLCRQSPAAELILAGGPAQAARSRSTISLSGLLLAAAEDSPQSLVLGSGTVYGEKLFHRGLCDLPTRCGVRLVSNKSSPGHGVANQSPAITIGATVDVGGGRRHSLGDLHPSCQLLIPCGNREHRGSCVRVAHPLREAPSLGSASHPLRRGRRIVHALPGSPPNASRQIPSE